MLEPWIAKYSEDLKNSNLLIESIDQGFKRGIGNRVVLQNFQRKKNVDELLDGYFAINLALILIGENKENSKDVALAFSLFRDAARYFEIVKKYSFKDYKAKTGSITELDFNILSAICYDIAGWSANAHVMAQRAMETLKLNDIDFRDFDSELNYRIGQLCLQYLSQSYSGCVKELSKLENLTDDYSEDEDLSLSLYRLACVQLFTAFKHLIDFWEKGSVEDYEGAMDFIVKAKENYLDSNRVMHYVTRLLVISFRYELERSIHQLSSKANESTYQNIDLFGDYKEMLVSEGIVSLWPSQIEFVKKGLPDHRAFVVSAPTSAGKSLIAEISLIDYFARKIKRGKVVYVVPSRALAAQVRNDLSKRLTRFSIVTEQLVGGNFIPLLDETIVEFSDILVVTTEKLRSLLSQEVLKREDISKLVVDESHNIGLGSRGLNLEVLLTNLLKTNQPKPDILMLSAVTKDPTFVSRWLDNSEGYLKDSWRPTRQIHVLLTKDGKLKFYDSLKGFEPRPYLNKKSTKTLRGRAIEVAKIFRQFGMVMIYGYSPNECEKIAEELSKGLEKKQINEDIKQAISDLQLDFRESKGVKISDLIEKGVAYHHSQLSDQVRSIVEELMRTEKIDFIVTTTTLAEGINSPISTLVIPQLTVGRSTPMTTMQYKNLAGRAGRALEQTEGYIVFIESDKVTEERVLDLKSKNPSTLEDIQSSLEDLIGDNSLFDHYKRKIARGEELEDYQEIRSNRSELNLKSVQKEMIVALAAKIYDGKDSKKFLDKTYFGSRFKNGYDNENKLGKVTRIINRQVASLVGLEVPPVRRNSPYRLLPFGYACYKAGLLPTTMSNLAIVLKSYRESETLDRLFAATYYDSSLDEELIQLFRLCFKADEIKLSNLDKTLKHESKAPIILSWVKGDTLPEIQKTMLNLIEGDLIPEKQKKKLRENSYHYTVDFVVKAIRNYGAWIVSGMTRILEVKAFKVEYNQLFEYLPFFLTYGTTSLLNGLFQQFEISLRTPLLRKITENIERKYKFVDVLDIELALKLLLNIEYEDLLFPGITQEDVMKVGIIWNKYKEFKKAKKERIEKTLEKIREKHESMKM